MNIVVCIKQIIDPEIPPEQFKLDPATHRQLRGGLMWTEERLGTRVNLARTEEVLRVGPAIVGTACPFCLSMFEDGIRAKDATERLQALGLTELVARAL